jgi:hypothetical protein
VKSSQAFRLSSQTFGLTTSSRPTIMATIGRLCFLLLLLTSTSIQQFTNVGGQLYVSGTLVVTAPASQPTLGYNCNKLPAICNNVAQVHQLGVPIDLHFDKNNNRKKARRNAACPSRWKFTNSCPEPNQPDTVGRGTSLGQGSFAARPYGRTQGMTQGMPGWNRIADAAGQFSGMMWQVLTTSTINTLLTS